MKKGIELPLLYSISMLRHPIYHRKCASCRAKGVPMWHTFGRERNKKVIFCEFGHKLWAHKHFMKMRRVVIWCFQSSRITLRLHWYVLCTWLVQQCTMPVYLKIYVPVYISDHVAPWSDLQPSRVSSLVSGAITWELRELEDSRSCCLVHSISDRFTHGAYRGDIFSYYPGPRRKRGQGRGQLSAVHGLSQRSESCQDPPH